MKILFDHQIFCLAEYGGISRYYYELFSHLAAFLENKVEIFAPLYINEYLATPNSVVHKGIKIPRLSRIGMVGALGVDSLFAYLALKLRRDVDIFHETYYSNLDYCPRSAKRIITVFDMIHEKFSDLSPGRKETRQAKAYAVKRADHIICISENTKRDLVELLKVSEKKVSVVYLGYSFLEKTRKKLLVREKRYILYVGKRSGYKNFTRLLRVYARSEMLRENFLLVCFGGGRFSSYERIFMKELGISLNRVLHFSGGDDVLAGLYGGAAVFVYPSVYEGFGIPILEAMSLGCPVVCSNSSSLPEVTGEAAELFDPIDETKMRIAIERVVSSPERSQLLVDRGYERIKQFSWERCAQDTLDVYNKVLSG